MSPQHLSDEAVAAFADGVLRGHARERATRHCDQCAECRSAVRAQREAAWALRTAPAPALPTGLFERLQALPAVTPIPTQPTVLADDGTTMLSTFAAPAAAIVPAARRSRRSAAARSTSARPDAGSEDADDDPRGSAGRGRGIVTGAAVVALTAGALVAGVAAHDDGPAGTPTVRPAVSREGVPTHEQLVGLVLQRR